MCTDFKLDSFFIDRDCSLGQGSGRIFVLHFTFIIHLSHRALATEVFLWLARTQETFCNPIRGPLGSRLLQEDSRLKRNEVISHNYKRYLWAPFLNLGGNGVEGADWECYLPLKGTKAALSLLQAYTPLNSPYHYFRSLQLFFFYIFLQFFAHSHVTHCRVVPVHFSQKLSNFYSIADFFYLSSLISSFWGY